MSLGRNQPAPFRRMPVHYCLLAAAEEVPHTGGEMAKLAGYSYGFVRRALADLVRCGWLWRSHAGYSMNLGR
jgi:hypothetical protein